MGLGLYDEMKNLIKTAEDSFTTALKLSIAGNIIDFGIFKQVSEELVYQTIEKCLQATLPVDSVNSLKEDIAQSRNILFWEITRGDCF